MPEKKTRTFGRTASAVENPPFQADQEEEPSPEVIAADGKDVSPPDEELPEPALKDMKPLQEEDKEDESKGRESDIYAEAVLACSIENPESCVMCSG